MRAHVRHDPAPGQEPKRLHRGGLLHRAHTLLEGLRVGHTLREALTGDTHRPQGLVDVIAHDTAQPGCHATPTVHILARRLIPSVLSGLLGLRVRLTGTPQLLLQLVLRVRHITGRTGHSLRRGHRPTAGTRHLVLSGRNRHRGVSVPFAGLS